MTHRFYGGQECWVYRTATVDELAGHHAELVAHALAPDDPPVLLLYAPRRDADAGPFGLDAQSGSHALAVTGASFIVSRDRHVSRPPACARRIPFATVLGLEIGEALTLGWLVIRFADGGRVAAETVIFTSTGIVHFRAAALAWRRAVTAARAGDAIEAGPRGIADGIPSFLGGQVLPLLLEREVVRGVARGAETWAAAGRRRRRLVAPPACCLATDDALIVGQGESAIEPGDLVFGVNATVLPRPAIRRLSIAPLVGDPASGASLSVDIEVAGVARTLCVPFGGCPASELFESVSRAFPELVCPS